MKRKKKSRSAASEAVGTAIRKRRKDLQLNQKQLAARIKKSVPTVSKIERGEHPLDVDTLTKVARGLKTSVTRLLWEAQRTRLEKDPEKSKMIPIFDSLLDGLEKSGVEL